MKGKALKFSLASMAVMAAMPTGAFAATTTPNIDPDQKGSITLYKLESEDGHYKDGFFQEDPDVGSVATKGIKGVGFKYLKVGDLVQVPSKNQVNVGLYYTLDDAFVQELASYGVTVNPTNVDGKTYYTVEDINKALKQLATTTQGYDNSNDGSMIPTERLIQYINTNGTAMPDTDEDGKTTVTDMAQGLYIIGEYKQPTAAPDGETQLLSRASAPFLMPLPMTNVAELDGHPAGTVWQYDLVAYPKSEMIVVRKDIIADGNDTEDGAGTNGLVQVTDKNVGDYVNFLLTLDVPALQPQVNGTPNTNRKYVVEDVMTDGLTLDSIGADNFVVKLGTAAYNAEEGLTTLEHTTDYTVEETNTDGKPGFKLTLTEAGLAKFDLLTADSKLYINYKARLNENAADPKGAIKHEENEYKLTYGTSVTKDHVFESNKDVKTYTYEVNVQKSFTRAVDDMTKVTFDVTKVDPESGAETTKVQFIEEAPGEYHVYDGKEAGEPTTTVKVSSEGKLNLRGLDNGKYSIKELTTVEGFNLLRDPIILTINADHPEDGAITSSTIKNGDNEIEVGSGLEQGCVNFEIKNNETITALHTGGSGWNSMIYVIGAASIIGGIAVITKSKKQEN